jgi:hypothetical protein
MTEAEWFAATDARMLLWLACGKASPRKLRLFMVGWCRHNWERLPSPLVRDAVDLAERFADGQANRKQLEARLDEARPWMFGGLARYLLWPDSSQMEDCVDRFCQNDLGLVASRADDGAEAYRASHRIRATLFRGIVGNPFRPVAFAPEWRTSTAVALASGMYESRDFSAMPILADALQDAGCDSDDVLSHCRDPQQLHVRGCWVVDLVLGRS